MDPKSEVHAEERGRGHLELRQEHDGARHYLEGRRLERGNEVELLLEDGQWLRGRYDWNGIAVVWPALRLELAGQISRHTERRLTGAMPIPPSAILRWPRGGH
jgi:hypothetical protein